MATEKQKKITVKIPETLFTLLEKKRATERITFQAVGIQCFGAWVRGEIMPAKIPVQEGDREECENYLIFLKKAPAFLVQAVKEILYGWQGSQAAKEMKGAKRDEPGQVPHP